MEIYKFGGASLSTADNVRAMGEIVRTVGTMRPLIVVVSAMGKVTNQLEFLLQAAMRDRQRLGEAMRQLRDFHMEMAEELLGGNAEGVRRVASLLESLESTVRALPHEDYDVLYDMVVPYGELLSSTIVAAFLTKEIAPAEWVDIRNALRTNNEHRNALVDTALSTSLVQRTFSKGESTLYVTQGFIASTVQGTTTTLGREGSDYTAALLGAMLQARAVTIWKDVPGFLSADPKLFPHAEFLPRLPYREAIEMSYSGAKVVHPKAVKPMQNAGIPLYVKSFASPRAEGTCIGGSEDEATLKLHDLIAVREGQVLLSVGQRDLSFASEQTVSRMFSILAAHRIVVNLLQQSAVSTTVCVDREPIHLPHAIEALRAEHHVMYNADLILLTVRHCSAALRSVLSNVAEALVRQETRLTVQVVLPREVWVRAVYPAMLLACERI